MTTIAYYKWSSLWSKNLNCYYFIINLQLCVTIDPGSDGPPYHCDICNKSFTTRVYLKKHKMLHTYVDEDKKVYACNECPELFLSSMVSYLLQKYHIMLKGKMT